MDPARNSIPSQCDVCGVRVPKLFVPSEQVFLCELCDSNMYFDQAYRERQRIGIDSDLYIAAEQRQRSAGLQDGGIIPRVWGGVGMQDTSLSAGGDGPTCIPSTSASGGVCGGGEEGKNGGAKLEGQGGNQFNFQSFFDQSVKELEADSWASGLGEGDFSLGVGDTLLYTFDKDVSESELVRLRAEEGLEYEIVRRRREGAAESDVVDEDFSTLRVSAVEEEVNGGERRGEIGSQLSHLGDTKVREAGRSRWEDGEGTTATLASSSAQPMFFDDGGVFEHEMPLFSPANVRDGGVNRGDQLREEERVSGLSELERRANDLDRDSPTLPFGGGRTHVMSTSFSFPSSGSEFNGGVGGSGRIVKAGDLMLPPSPSPPPTPLPSSSLSSTSNVSKKSTTGSQKRTVKGAKGKYKREQAPPPSSCASSTSSTSISEAKAKISQQYKGLIRFEKAEKKEKEKIKKKQQLQGGQNNNEKAPSEAKREDGKEKKGEDGEYMVGKLTDNERRAALIRYLRKKERRSFGIKVKYITRKVMADSRPRVKGRFAKLPGE